MKYKVSVREINENDFDINSGRFSLCPKDEFEKSFSDFMEHIKNFSCVEGLSREENNIIFTVKNSAEFEKMWEEIRGIYKEFYLEKFIAGPVSSLVD